MFSLADLLLVVLTMTEAVVFVAGMAGCLLLASRVARFLFRNTPWPLARNRR